MGHRFKMQPMTGKGLCNTCRDGFVVLFENGGNHTRCRAGGEDLKVSRAVISCSQYENKNTTSKWDMEKIAWTVRTDRSGQTVGFVPPKKDD